MPAFMRIRGIMALLVVLMTSLLAGCGDEADVTEPTEQPRAASPLSATSTPSDTRGTPPAESELSAPIVVPLDPSGGQEYKLYVIDTNGSEPHRLTPARSEIVGSESDAAWSPDGQRIVFVGYVGDGVDLFSIDADGSNLRNLTNLAGHVIQPSWSPDSSQIVYIRSDSDSRDIYVVAADGTANRRLTSGTGDESAPVWSPDGEWIAFLRTEFVPDLEQLEATEQAMDDDSDGDIAMPGEFKTDIWVVRPDGSDERTLANVQFAERLRWSPDGQRLAYCSFESFGANQHARVAYLDGTEQVTLDDGTVWSSLPAWSPDGSRISLVVTDQGGSAGSIVVMNADGSDARSISDLTGAHSWSPDSRQIVVSQGRIAIDGAPTGRSDVYVIDADGATAPQRLLEDAALGSDPAWSPVLSSSAP